MFKAGRIIKIEEGEGPFQNVKGIFVAPEIEIFGVKISATKPIPKNVEELLKKHKMDVQIINEDGDDLVRLTGEFKIDPEQFRLLAAKNAEKQAKATIASIPETASAGLKPRTVPKMGAAAASASSPSAAAASSAAPSANPGSGKDKDSDGKSKGDKATGGDAAAGGADRKYAAAKEAELGSNESPVKPAVHFQRHLQVNVTRKKAISASKSSFGTVFQNSLIKSPVILGPTNVMSIFDQDLVLPNALLKPGQDPSKVGNIQLGNALLFTSLGNKVVINAPNALILSGGHGDVVGVKAGCLTEVISGDIHLNSSDATIIKDCVIRASDTIVIRAKGNLHIGVDNTVTWANKPEYPSFTTSFTAFQTTDQLLAELAGPANTAVPGAPAPGGGASAPTGSPAAGNEAGAANTAAAAADDSTSAKGGKTKSKRGK